jgi:hypothetical protein
MRFSSKELHLRTSETLGGRTTFLDPDPLLLLKPVPSTAVKAHFLIGCLPYLYSN